MWLTKEHHPKWNLAVYFALLSGKILIEILMDFAIQRDFLPNRWFPLNN